MNSEKDSSVQKSNTPLVSICCLAYNHEPYIRECLEGFIMQKADFDFEVLIHDDASTDNTAYIIREYEEKYPDIIKPIYQKENQYSKKIGISKTFQYPRAKGKYIALCEGDDYWIDLYKLQKQVDFLENNPDYVLSNTDSDVLYDESGWVLHSYNKNKRIGNYTGKVGMEEILSGHYFIKTGSVVLKKELLEEYYSSEFYQKMKSFLLMGDTPLWAYLTIKGGFHYLEESTLVYRRHKGSASNKVNNINLLKFELSSSILRMFFIENYPNNFSKEFNNNTVSIYNKTVFQYLLFSKYENFPFLLDVETTKKIELVKRKPFLKFLFKSVLVLEKFLFRLLQDCYYWFNSKF